MPAAMFVQFLVIATISCVPLSIVATKDIVEVLFVVEPQVIRNYIKTGYDNQTAETTLRGDIDFTLYQMNQLYASMNQYGLDIEIRMKRLIIMKDEMFEDCKLVRHNDIQVDLGMEVFKEWLKANNLDHDDDGFDLALLWTGYDAFASGGSRATAGYAVVSGICSKSALAIVEFGGTQSAAAVTAHEIGHSLGSEHDGINECSASLGHIMTPVSEPDFKHRWSFSHCSARSIRKNLQKLQETGKDCLRRTTTKAAIFDMSSQANRDIMNVQKICQRDMKTSEAYMCTSPGLYRGHAAKGDTICSFMFCGIKGHRSCETAIPTEGMVCDAGKRCSKGRCLPAPATFPVPKTVRSDCVFGDLKSGHVFQTNYSCPAYLNKKGNQMCYQHYVHDICCDSCRKRSTNIKGCEYGSQSHDCAKYTPSVRFCNRNRKYCCYECRHYPAKRSALLEDVYAGQDIPLPEMDDVIIQPDEEIVDEPVQEEIRVEDPVYYSME